jgi:hypothetical protein
MAVSEEDWRWRLDCAILSRVSTTIDKWEVCLMELDKAG